MSILCLISTAPSAYLYNKKMADASDLNTLDCLWNGKYKDNMIMINSVRDAFTPALRTLGYSINETDTAKLDEAFDILKQTKQ